MLGFTKNNKSNKQDKRWKIAKKELEQKLDYLYKINRDKNDMELFIKSIDINVKKIDTCEIIIKSNNTIRFGDYYSENYMTAEDIQQIRNIVKEQLIKHRENFKKTLKVKELELMNLLK